MRNRWCRTGSVLSIAAVAAIGLAACGDSDSTATGDASSSSAATTAANAPGSAAPSSASNSPALDPNAPSTTNPAAEAVPGPQLPPATAVPPSKQAPNIAGVRCDTANGPEGALRVVVFPGGSAGCGVVMPVAKKYGPLISTGRNQAVDGWDCGPSQTAGVLAKCTRGSDSFGFIPQ